MPIIQVGRKIENDTLPVKKYQKYWNKENSNFFHNSLIR